MTESLGPGAHRASATNPATKSSGQFSFGCRNDKLVVSRQYPSSESMTCPIGRMFALEGDFLNFVVIFNYPRERFCIPFRVTRCPKLLEGFDCARGLGRCICFVGTKWKPVSSSHNPRSKGFQLYVIWFARWRPAHRQTRLHPEIASLGAVRHERSKKT